MCLGRSLIYFSRFSVAIAFCHLQRLQSEFRLLLTGTPLQNNLLELWSLLNFLDPVKFDSISLFEADFGVLETGEQVERLQSLIMPHLLRRVKEDVEHSIPKKEETIIDVELTTLQVPRLVLFTTPSRE